MKLTRRDPCVRHVPPPFTQQSGVLQKVLPSEEMDATTGHQASQKTDDDLVGG